MKKLLAIAFALMVFCTSFALADTEITVPGHGIVYTSADTATITLGVNAQKADVKEAQSAVNTTLASILQALLGAGVQKEDISTDTINVYTLWDSSETGEEIIRYCASSSLVIRTTVLENVGMLIDVAIGAGANSLSGVSFSLADSSQQQETALRAALEDARKQAEIIAQECGLTITGVESVTEESSYSYNADITNWSKVSAGAESAAGTVVQPAKIGIEATVRVIYEAKPAK